MPTPTAMLISKIDREVKKRAGNFACVSFLTIQGANGSADTEYSVTHEVIEALQECLPSPPHVLYDAATIWFSHYAKVDIAPAQLAALLHIVGLPQQLELIELWRLEVTFARNGSLRTNVGAVDLTCTEGCWRVCYASKQADLGEAVRTAAVIAATLPQRG